MISAQVAKLDAVLRHYARASSVLIKSQWWPYDSTSRRRVYYACRETECRQHDITLRRRACCAGRETRLRQYDTAPKRRAYNERRETGFRSYDTTTPLRRANCARTEIGWRPYDTPNTVHVAKPDAVCTTLHSGVVRAVQVAKPDCVNTTRRPNVVPTVHVGKSHLFEQYSNTFDKIGLMAMPLKSSHSRDLLNDSLGLGIGTI